MKVGKYVHPKKETLTRYYETASWYSKHEVEAGATSDLSFDGYWFVAKVPAMQVEAFFVNRLLTASSAQHSFDPKPSAFGFQWDAYGLARAVQDGRVTLDSGWHVVKVGDYSDGKPMYRVEKTEVK